MTTIIQLHSVFFESYIYDPYSLTACSVSVLSVSLSDDEMSGLQTKQPPTTNHSTETSSSTSVNSSTSDADGTGSAATKTKKVLHAYRIVLGIFRKLNDNFAQLNSSVGFACHLVAVSCFSRSCGLVARITIRLLSREALAQKIESPLG